MDCTGTFCDTNSVHLAWAKKGTEWYAVLGRPRGGPGSGTEEYSGLSPSLSFLLPWLLLLKAYAVFIAPGRPDQECAVS